MAKRGPKPKYKPQEWFLKKWFLLKAGVHFTCATKSMDVYIRQLSLDYGYRITVETLSKDVLKVIVHGKRAS